MEGDYSLLSEHIVLTTLPEKIAPFGKKCLSLVWCDGETLLVWNAAEGCVEAVSVKPVLRDGDLKSSGKIFLNPCPLFDVERVTSNGGGKVFAVLGAGGVTAVRFPTKGSGDWEGLWEAAAVNLECGDPWEVVAAEWHPGSPSETHLAVLSSDECLRLFEAATGSTVWSVYLARSAPTTSDRLPGPKAIGDTVVSFAFGPPELKKDYEETTWPILALWGNGDIYQVKTRLKESGTGSLGGPLRIDPPTEDNYGCEATSILILAYSSPPLVLVATSTGVVHHFLLLGESLLAVERIELEAGLVLGEDPDVPTCVTLLPDPSTPARYLTVSPVGVHSVGVPYAQGLGNPLPPSLPPSEPSFVLCTSVSTEANFSRAPLAALVHLDCNLWLAAAPSGRLVELRLPPPPGPKTVGDTPLPPLEAPHPPLLALPPALFSPKYWLAAAMVISESSREKAVAAWSSAAASVDAHMASTRASLASQLSTAAALSAARPALRSGAESLADRLEEAADGMASLASRSAALLSVLGRHTPLSLQAAASLEASLRNFSLRSALLSKEVERLKQTALPTPPDITSALALAEKDLYLGETKKKVIRKHLEYLTSEIHALTKRIKELKLATNNLRNQRNRIR